MAEAPSFQTRSTAFQIRSTASQTGSTELQTGDAQLPTQSTGLLRQKYGAPNPKYGVPDLEYGISPWSPAFHAARHPLAPPTPYSPRKRRAGCTAAFEERIAMILTRRARATATAALALATAFVSLDGAAARTLHNDDVGSSNPRYAGISQPNRIAPGFSLVVRARRRADECDEASGDRGGGSAGIRARRAAFPVGGN